MYKQKEIEEMAKIIDINCGECYSCKYNNIITDINCGCLLQAEELYNAGYRKIPEIKKRRKKMIKEMEKDIAIRMDMAKGVVGSMNNGVEGWLCEYLVKKGWIKSTENAVVLTREEYEFIKDIKDRIRKETAKDILEKLWSYMGSNQKFWIVNEEHITIIDCDKLWDFTEEIAKEITEGTNGN